MEHPDIQRSVLWHLSKVIGKQSLAPQEMMRQYLTDPNFKNSTDVFTIDKKELEKLQKDLLENPEKYEEMLK